jgi:hypothetical protein
MSLNVATLNVKVSTLFLSSCLKYFKNWKKSKLVYLPQIKSCGENPLLLLAVKEALTAGGKSLFRGCLQYTTKQIRECRAFFTIVGVFSIPLRQVEALPILTGRESNQSDITAKNGSLPQEKHTFLGMHC